MAQYIYQDFIKENVAPKNSVRIGVYRASGAKVGTIPLGKLSSIDEEPLYKFGLLSDIHVDTTDYNYAQYLSTYPYSDEGKGDFARALKWLVEHENVNMVCSCGDMSQNGTPAEFAMPQEVISQYLPESQNIPFYTCTGNHDVKVAGGNGFNSYFRRNLETTWGGMKDFEVSTAYTESFCFTKLSEENCDHFIFFSMYSYSVGDSGTPYLDADIQWLQNKLELWKNQRVFLFTHMFFPDYAGNLGRINGSGGIYPSGNWLGGTQLNKMMRLLATYPNVIWFSGHSHWKWDLQKYQANANIARYGIDDAWTVHVPSCALPIDSDYSSTTSQTSASRREKPLESQGGVVYVYPDRIEIKGIDFNINTSENGSTEQSYSGDTYVRYLPIADYDLETPIWTMANLTDPIQGYGIVAESLSGKTTGETMTKLGDYINITFTNENQCVCVTNGLLSSGDTTSGCVLLADDIQVWYGDSQIPLDTISNLGFYTIEGTYAPLNDVIGQNGIVNGQVEQFPCYDSNMENLTEGYYAQINVSRTFVENNDWCTEISETNPVIFKIRGLRINGKRVNKQKGNIGESTVDESTYIQKTNFEVNAAKTNTNLSQITNLDNNMVSVNFSTPSQGFWVSPPNIDTGQTQTPTLIVDYLKVYSGTTTDGTEITLPSNVGFYDGTKSGTARYGIENLSTPSYENEANGRLQFQTASGYNSGNITIVMKVRFEYS